MDILPHALWIVLLLVYVVDFSAAAPWDGLQVLREELEKYQPGMNIKARVVVANKADLFVGGQERNCVNWRRVIKPNGLDYPGHSNKMKASRTLDVVRTSTKFS